MLFSNGAIENQGLLQNVVADTCMVTYDMVWSGTYQYQNHDSYLIKAAPQN